MNKKQAREMGIEDGYWMVRTNWNEYVHQFIILDRMSYIEFMDSVLDAVAETEVNSRDEDTKDRFESSIYPYHVLLKEYEAGVVVGAKRAVKELRKSAAVRATAKEPVPRKQFKISTRIVPIKEAKKGDMVEVYVGTPWPDDSEKERVTGEVVYVKKDGTVTVNVEKTRENPGGHSNKDVNYVDFLVPRTL